MKISARVNIYEKDNLKGFASINIDDKIIIKNLRIIDGGKGLFVAYPSTYSEKDQKYYEDVHPKTLEIREKIQKIVLEEYEKVKAKSSDNEI